MDDMRHSVRLVADIGGTHARFALLDAHGRPSQVRVLKCANYPELETAILAYLARVGDVRPSAAVIAIANPVTGDRIAMTNHHWSFSTRELQAQLGLASLTVVNDFAALAAALPLLTSRELVQIGGGAAVPDTPIGVLGPGTGLGVAGLIRVGKHWCPLAGEGGHVTLAPADDFESDILARLRQRWSHVSAERILSGPGLVVLREAIGAMRQQLVEPLDPAEITRRALAGSDALCRETLATFCAMLGSVAGNLALTLGARGGIYLGGGILTQLGSYLAESPFRARFEAKGRFASYLAAIPCYVIRAEQPALLGASRFFEIGEELRLEA